MNARMRLVLPHRMAQAKFQRVNEEEIKPRVRWWRFKQWLCSREVWLTFAALLIVFLASVFIAGKAFAQELPESPGFDLIDQREIRFALIFGGLALLLCSLAILDYLLLTDRLGPKKPDEGRVRPERPW